MLIPYKFHHALKRQYPKAHFLVDLIHASKQKKRTSTLLTHSQKPKNKSTFQSAPFRKGVAGETLLAQVPSSTERQRGKWLQKGLPCDNEAIAQKMLIALFLSLSPSSSSPAPLLILLLITLYYSFSFYLF